MNKISCASQITETITLPAWSYSLLYTNAESPLYLAGIASNSSQNHRYVDIFGKLWAEVTHCFEKAVVWTNVHARGRRHNPLILKDIKDHVSHLQQHHLTVFQNNSVELLDVFRCQHLFRATGPFVIAGLCTATFKVSKPLINSSLGLTDFFFRHNAIIEIELYRLFSKSQNYRLLNHCN